MVRNQQNLSRICVYQKNLFFTYERQRISKRQCNPGQFLYGVEEGRGTLAYPDNSRFYKDNWKLIIMNLFCFCNYSPHSLPSLSRNLFSGILGLGSEVNLLVVGCTHFPLGNAFRCFAINKPSPHIYASSTLCQSSLCDVALSTYQGFWEYLFTSDYVNRQAN